jgi:hypothetical protein
MTGPACWYCISAGGLFRYLDREFSIFANGIFHYCALCRGEFALSQGQNCDEFVKNVPFDVKKYKKTFDKLDNVLYNGFHKPCKTAKKV